MSDPTGPETPSRTAVLIGYLLLASGLFIGVTYVVAPILAYAKCDEAEGSWLESHYRWQIRTFWFSLLWLALGAALVLLFVLSLFFFFVLSRYGILELVPHLYVGGAALMVGDIFWVLYRIIRGGLRLSRGRPMYAAE